METSSRTNEGRVALTLTRFVPAGAGIINVKREQLKFTECRYVKYTIILL